MGEELSENGSKKKHSDEENASFWNTLANAREQLDTISANRFADEFWDDMDEPSEEEMREFMQREDETHRVANAHPLTVMAKHYHIGVAQWLESAKTDIATAAEDIVAQARHETDSTAGTARKEFDEFEDIIEIVTWYHTLLYPKTGRLVHGILEDGPASGRDGEDTLGTAKLLLVSIDRCIAAWKLLLDHLPSQEPHILQFLITLDRFRRTLEKTIPSARTHLRPGFDW